MWIKALAAKDGWIWVEPVVREDNGIVFKDKESATKQRIQAHFDEQHNRGYSVPSCYTRL